MLLSSAPCVTCDADDLSRRLTDLLSDVTQRQVLAFYRTVVRQTRKQSAAQRGPIAAYARGEFERHVTVAALFRDGHPVCSTHRNVCQVVRASYVACALAGTEMSIPKTIS
jgi:Complex 1 protein (LYR family)